MPAPTFSFSEQRHREWVVILSGQRIASVYAWAKFERALQAGELRVGEQEGRVRAVYAITERDGTLRAACAFAIARNERGELERELRAPLRELASKAAEGPDLEHGPVRLARSGNCPTPWHAARLWGAEEADVDTYLLAAQSLLKRQIAAGPKARVAAAAARETSEDPTVSRLSAARTRREAGDELVLTARQLDALNEKHRKEVKELQKEIVALRRELAASRWSAA